MNPAADAMAVGFNPALVRIAAYRPLDRRYHYSHTRWNDRPRTQLSAAWGTTNFCLFSLPNNTGRGPAIWCHGAYPDRHAFKGSYGGYAFPLYDRRIGPDATNLSSTLIRGLAEAYGGEVPAGDVFDAILALLSATSYTRRFAEDLEDVFPHIPFPADYGIFSRAVDLGREIRAIETFLRVPRGQPPSFCRLASEPTGPVAAVAFQDGEIAICADGSGRITGIPQVVWDFAISGYRVLPRWIDGRIGVPANLALVRELRDVAARIAELLPLFDAADIVLDATLAHTLTVGELGFVVPPDDDQAEAVHDE